MEHFRTTLIRQLRHSVLLRVGGAALIAERDAAIGERNAYLRQRDEAIGERNAYLRQRDEAIGERNEFSRQLAHATSRIETALRPNGKALHDLVRSIDSVVTQPSSIFFFAVDRARLKFRDAVLSADALGDGLLGVKLINLVIAKHEYLWGAVAKAARPIGFMLDPANQCHLGCPSCTNSFNREVADKLYKAWPRGLMSESTFDTFSRNVALYAFSGHFYNNHEPLLNKLTPAFVRKATDLGVHTLISSNLSYRKIDAEAIVASGLARSIVFNAGARPPVKSNVEPYRDMIVNALSESAIERWQRMTGGIDPIDDDKTGDRCDWLHLAVISDAMGRIVPCCLGDLRSAGRFVLSDVREGDGLMNTEAYRRARRILAEASHSEAYHPDRLACTNCQYRPTPQIGIAAAGSYIMDHPVFAGEDMSTLYNWSGHNVRGPQA
jgi:hypothetical protein